MEQYRRGFYVNIVSGRDAGQGPQRRGGLLGGAGLSGFTGVGAGGFGTVGNIAAGQQGGAAGGAAGGAGAAQAGGYLGLLQDAQQIRNQEGTVAALADSLAQLDAAYEAGRIDKFQVDLARQALYNTAQPVDDQSRQLRSLARSIQSIARLAAAPGIADRRPALVAIPTHRRGDPAVAKPAHDSSGSRGEPDHGVARSASRRRTGERRYGPRLDHSASPIVRTGHGNPARSRRPCADGARRCRRAGKRNSSPYPRAGETAGERLLVAGETATA